jgi:hypothetical protein
MLHKFKYILLSVLVIGSVEASAHREITREAAEICGSMRGHRASECFSYQQAPVQLRVMDYYENAQGYSEGVDLCRAMPYGRVAECLGVISVQGFSPEGARLCRGISYDKQKQINCLATIAGKELSRETLRGCARLPCHRQIDCLAMQRRSAPERIKEIVMDFVLPGFGHVHEKHNDCYGEGSGHAEAVRVCGNLPYHLVPQCIGAISGKKFSVAEARVCGNLPYHLVISCLNAIRSRC